MPLLDGTTNPLFLNGTQIQTLVSELTFLSAFVADPLLDTFVAAAAQLTGRGSHGASNDTLQIEFP